MMLIPQGMAYALLAGLPPVMGLYASMLPMILYALMGTSRQVSVGPVALDSILVAVGIGTLANAGSEAYITLAILLAASIGVIQLVMGIIRMGFLVNFLSYPVLCGFSTAAALITAISQLKHLVGVSLTQAYDLTTVFTGLYTQRSEINPLTLIIGISTILFMLVLRRRFPRIPGPLSVVMLGTFLVWALNLDTLGVKIVGEVPSGLPHLVLPIPDWSMIGALLPLALTMALVGFAQTISIAKSLAHKQGYDIDANQELIGLGLANMGSSLTQGYSVSGGLSRSAVNARAGAHTPLAAVLTSIFIGVTLLYFTPLIFYLPNVALAAIILVSALGLIDMREIQYLFRVKKTEGALLVFTFIATLSIGITYGLLLGIIASILLFIILNTRPHTAILGRLPGTDIFRNIVDFTEAETIDGLVILRIDASLYFANTEFLKAKAREVCQQYGDSLKAIILDASAVNDLDSSADTALHQISAEFKSREIEFYIAGIKGPVRKVMQRSGLYDVLGGDHFFFTIDAAVKRYLSTVTNYPQTG
jgi:SulP family sulfate permease